MAYEVLEYPSHIPGVGIMQLLSFAVGRLAIQQGSLSDFTRQHDFMFAQALGRKTEEVTEAWSDVEKYKERYLEKEDPGDYDTDDEWEDPQ